MSRNRIDIPALIAATVFAVAVGTIFHFVEKHFDEECETNVLDHEDVYLVHLPSAVSDFVFESFDKDDPKQGHPRAILAWFASTRRELVQKCMAGPVNGRRLLTREERLCLGATNQLCTSRKDPPLVN